MQELYDILKCPDCGGSISSEKRLCLVCQRDFSAQGSGIISMLPLKAKEVPAAYSDPDYIKWQKMFPYVFESRGMAHTMIDESTHRWTASAFAQQKYRNNGWIADLGCGVRDGFGQENVPDKTIGIDINKSYLEKLRENNQRRLLIQADMESLPLQDGVVRYCFVLHALEHIYNLKKAVEEIERVTEAGGYIYIGLPCEGGWLRDILRSMTTARRNSRRFGIDYEKVCRIEHCQKAYNVIQILKQRFKMTRSYFFPFSVMPSLDFNLTVSFEFQKVV